MSTRSSLIAGAALTCLLAVMGCGDDADPAVVPGQDGNDGSQDGNVGDGDGDGITDDGSDGSTEDGEPGDGGDGTGDGGDGTGDGAGDGDGDGTPGACDVNMNFVGQAYEKDNAPNNGGMETDQPYADTYDSGIAALVAAKPAEGQEATVDIALTEATVIATTFERFANQTFWLQDGKAAVQVALAADAPFTIVVGSKVSAKVTSVKNNFGALQVKAATDWAVVSVDQPVYIDDRTGEDIVEADLGKLVRITGTLAGEGTACGGSSKCWTLEHGGKSIGFRSGRPETAAGDCVTFVGPVGSFDGVPQLDSPNWDWTWTNE
jgi:hypothetical protein